MGQVVNLLNKEGQKIGEAGHTAACESYALFIAKKYKEDFSSFFYSNHSSSEWKKVFGPILKDATDEDVLVMKLFLETNFEVFENYHPIFLSAIKQFPEDRNDAPKRMLEKYADFLKENKYFKTSESHFVSAYKVIH
jgi:hypothetical protein